MGVVDPFRRRASKPPTSQHALAMVLLPNEDRPDGRSVFQYLRTQWADVPSIANVESFLILIDPIGSITTATASGIGTSGLTGC